MTAHAKASKVELTVSEKREERSRATEAVIHFIQDSIHSAEHVIVNGDNARSRARFTVRKSELVWILRWLGGDK